MESRHGLVVETEAPEQTALTVLGHDVRRCAEPQRQVTAGLGVEIEAHAPLPAILVVEHEGAVRASGLRSQPTQKVGARNRLDLDDLRTEIGEDAAQLGNDGADAEIDDADTGEHWTVRR